ncbi:hypothetical protein N1851_034410 [Merluccius polli]|uniref:DUF5641 domain-containing protein n=1 Tax=Merluccius polli TaxID=89951 RepID=A0AA47NLP1_MERPO|nr:hypothetical protein N1851_034410 [Merluccius polli]
MAVVRARDKAEAAQARAAYANREIAIQVQTACIQATLEAWQQEKEINASLAKQICSHCDTNFIDACHELKMDTSSCSSVSMAKYLQEQKCSWVFNPPHSSQMFGAWERMIGIARCILDCMLLQGGSSRLRHEVLTSFIAEVTAGINARPLVPVSSDLEAPLILTPAPAPPPGRMRCRRAELFKDEWKRPNLKERDIVLMKDNPAKKNKWPMAVIVKVTRPVTEVLLLLSPEESSE